ncbi:MAG: hypothetical protein GY854_29275 [Deltaproteobacteria bacterium]|nr:hypothetical protein [Deltaproteobacteria bacterium]
MTVKLTGLTKVAGVDVQRLSRKLAKRLAPFAPDIVVYVEQGGAVIGQEVARELMISAIGLDISYPLSRLLNRAPSAVKLAAWPIKELVYRLASPGLRTAIGGIDATYRVALVDDSASTGRSLQVAVRTLEAAGIERRNIEIAVIRCGSRARSIVDHFETEQPVLFVGR